MQCKGDENAAVKKGNPSNILEVADKKPSELLKLSPSRGRECTLRESQQRTEHRARLAAAHGAPVDTEHLCEWMTTSSFARSSATTPQNTFFLSENKKFKKSWKYMFMTNFSKIFKFVAVQSQPTV